MNDNVCVSCGGYAPEGHMLCYNCRMESDPNRKMTLKVNVKIDWFSKVHEFVKLATLCPGEVYFVGDDYRVSGKSLMGAYSLDITKPIVAEFYGEVPTEVLEKIKEFIIEEE